MKSPKLYLGMTAICFVLTCCDNDSDDNNNCSDSNTCSAQTDIQCSMTKPCPKPEQTCSDQGFCVIPISPGQAGDEECSQSKPCSSTDVCTNGKCLKTIQQSCYGDKECPDGFACDNQKCVDARACSLTRTCAGTQVCQNGLCVDRKAPACDSKHPCADAAQTCVAGNCVACHCNENETCEPDGTCASKGIATQHQLKEGDDCDWQTFEPFCEGNQKFSCYSDGDGYKVHSMSCDAKVCADASEEEIGCYDACVDDGTFFGECVNTFSTDATAEFTRECELTKDNKRIWTLKHGFKDCEVGCQNGRCIFVPAEFKESCTPASYPDACKGDWITYCYNQSGSAMGIKTGTYCPSLSERHFCALPGESAKAMESGILGYCNLPCTENGKRHSECASDEDGNAFSMTYLCAQDTNGALSDFQISQSPCENGCNEDSGECR